ncbi:MULTISPECIES: energy-coupling factor transporter transmembrane component T [Halobacterium]|uniref:Biotin transport system permease protein n=4 Tax=Halobacterium salinarum TaxID=2242 RepID=A0A841HAS2_HALSI|nr:MULTISPECIES: energy-coupling factor transporter transmembrane component T [Halobacterium]MBB6089644.1 biotin transport system permease protein [Halobacterium salinarum]MDL0119823.1 energy-coupling factor transporter transmembrane component T [Halobacterium salinarum]MDL0130317.1 energy-coupling factor transporter transmembrane component T [Halobacterium salinarum]QRY22474.1 energy-coupling factor transporter transmembrane protein EcfT [Halobacterium sp. GSL-19]QRY24554.1 energy-coupling fa
MTLAYRPGGGVLHRLDPRAKLALQAGFAAAAFAHTTVLGLAALTPVAVVVPRLAGASVRDVLGEFRAVAPFLLAAPAVAGLTLGEPWFRIAPAARVALASYRVLLVLLVAATYVYSTPVRDSRAAVRWLLPGKLGAATGIGVALVFRFLPVLQGDLTARRDAVNARLGGERSIRERIRLVAVGGLGRALSRADRLAVALRARCFAWNPTSPPLAYARRDWLATAAAAGLAGTVLV